MSNGKKLYQLTAQKAKAVLEEQGLSPFRIAERTSDFVGLVLILPTDDERVTERRVTVNTFDNLILMETPVFFTLDDAPFIARVVNAFNLAHPEGSAQYDARDGELFWTQFIPAARGEWPGDTLFLDTINAALATSRALSRTLEEQFALRQSNQNR